MRRIKIALAISLAAVLSLIVWTVPRPGTLPKEAEEPCIVIFPNDTTPHKFYVEPQWNLQPQPHFATQEWGDRIEGQVVEVRPQSAE
jgi:hypothetical protein